MFGLCGQVGHFFGVAQQARRNACGTHRQCGAREEALNAMPVFGMDAAGLAGRVIEKAPGFEREFVHDAAAALQPVGALEQDQEIVSAHMADEVTPRIAMGHHQARHQPDHLVAAPVAILVVEGLEVVQVGIAGHEAVAAFEQALDVHADGDVAGQEGQRVGMACRLDARLGHGAHQLVARAQADVAAVVGDDEAVAEVALVLRGQDADELVHVAVQLDDAGSGVGEGDAGLAAMHFAEVQRGVVVHELLAVDQCHGALVLHHGHGMQLGVVHEQLGHGVVRGVGCGSGGLHHLQTPQDAGARRLGEVGQHGHAAVLHHFEGRAVKGWPGGQGGSSQQPALAVGDVEVTQHAQVVLGFDALGHELGAEHVGNAFDGAQHLQVLGLFDKVVYEIFVDLHVVGFDFRPQPQAGASVAKVVQRQAHAGGVHGLDGLAQRNHVGHAVVLGDFQHQHPGQNAEVAQGRAQLACAAQCHTADQRIGTDVHEQPPCGAQGGPVPQGDIDAHQFKVRQDAFTASHVQQRVGTVQGRSYRATDQGLVGENGSGTEVSQGLENAMQSPFPDQLCEGARARAHGGREGCDHVAALFGVAELHGV